MTTEPIQEELLLCKGLWGLLIGLLSATVSAVLLQLPL
jgi:hypothetical protein